MPKSFWDSTEGLMWKKQASSQVYELVHSRLRNAHPQESDVELANRANQVVKSAINKVIRGAEGLGDRAFQGEVDQFIQDCESASGIHPFWSTSKGSAWIASAIGSILRTVASLFSRRFGSKYTKDDFAVSEIASDAAYTVVTSCRGRKGEAGFDGEQHFRAHCYTTATKLAYAYQPAVGEDPDAPNPDRTTSEQVSCLDEIEALKPYMARLTPTQREVLEHRVLKGHTFDEISKRCGITLNQAYAEYQKALQSLRRMVATNKGHFSTYYKLDDNDSIAALGVTRINMAWNKQEGVKISHTGLDLNLTAGLQVDIYIKWPRLAAICVRDNPVNLTDPILIPFPTGELGSELTDFSEATLFYHRGESVLTTQNDDSNKANTWVIKPWIDGEVVY